jgi:uncharacterized protein (TIGR02996 family)
MAVRVFPPSRPRPQVLALLEESKESPEDAPRLVLADWLEEHGDRFDALRAELIRVGCRAASLPRFDPSRSLRAPMLPSVATGPSAEGRRKLEEREKELLPRAWPLDSRLTCRTRRGLLHLTCLASALGGDPLDDPPVPEGWAWLEGLKLIALRRDAQAVAGSPLLAYPAALDLSDERLNPAAIETLAASPHLGGLKELTLYGVRGLGARGLRAVVSSPNLPGLRKLCVANSWLGGANALAFRSLCLPALASLDAGENQLGAPGVQTLASAPGFASLTRLSLAEADLGAEGLRALLEAPRPPALLSLNLGGNNLGDDEARSLAASPLLASLTELKLSANPLSDEGVAALAGSPHLARLERLSLGRTRVRDAGLLALANSPHLARLSRVSVDVAYRITAGALQELEKRFGPDWND